MSRNLSTFLALRYLRPKRSFVSVITLISVLGVMLGVGVLMVGMSIFKGWQVEFRKMLVGFEPHVLLTRQQIPPAPDGAEMKKTSWREVLAMVENRTGIISATPVTNGYLAIESETEPQIANGFGLLPEGGSALQKKLLKHLTEGEFNLDGDNIIISERLAGKLKVKIGDVVVVHSSDNLRKMMGEVREIEEKAKEAGEDADFDGVTILPQELTVVGLMRGDTMGERAYFPLHIGRDLFNLEGDDVSGIEIELGDPDQAESLRAALFEMPEFPLDWEVRLWSDGAGSLLQMVENQKSLMYFLLLIIMVVAAFCVMNTTITVTVQKRREIGILTALGTRVGQIIGVFMAQAAFVSILGIILGLIGGGLFLHWRNEIRSRVADLTGRDFFSQDIYFLSSVPSEIQAADLLSICGVAVLLCLLAALWPAWAAARVDPAVALRD
jgi:lipoprotein-releasing system permease protein